MQPVLVNLLALVAAGRASFTNESASRLPFSATRRHDFFFSTLISTNKKLSLRQTYVQLTNLLVTAEERILYSRLEDTVPRAICVVMLLVE